MLLLHRLASSSSIRPTAITRRGSGSTVPTDSTADTLIGVLIITGINQSTAADCGFDAVAAVSDRRPFVLGKPNVASSAEIIVLLIVDRSRKKTSDSNA